MAFVVTAEGRFRWTPHLTERFQINRYGTPECDETHPDGHIVCFRVRDNKDGSWMTIDEDEAEELEALWQAARRQQVAPEALEARLAEIFDVLCPLEEAATSPH